MIVWAIVLGLVGLFMLYFVVKYAVLSALRTMDEERYEREVRRTRTSRPVDEA